jgi:cell division cycle 20-like protein 1 (cofactor of APC complex)
MGLDSEGSGAASLSAALRRPVPDSHNPAVLTPSRIATPPPPLEARQGEALGGRPGARTSRAASLDTDAVDHALRRDFGRQQRESTPNASPHRKRQRINGDR